MKKHLSIRVQGKVQGVFFRLSTQKKAVELGLCGKVCNMQDGSVAIEVEGGQKELGAFIEWLHDGPRAAKVVGVDSRESDLCGYVDFKIERIV